MTDVVIGGRGEVGGAIARVLGCPWIDRDEQTFETGPVSIMHVAIPWSATFGVTVEVYRAGLKPSVTVIHSSVPIGTSDALGAVYSPVRGRHPELAESLRAFIKYFAGPDAQFAAGAWAAAVGPVEIASDTRSLEAMKLWDTLQLGLDVMRMQAIFDFCQQHGLVFSTVYDRANASYSEGYAELGLEHLSRPSLRYQGEGIGGHCVRENAALLDHPLARLVAEQPAR